VSFISVPIILIMYLVLKNKKYEFLVKIWNGIFWNAIIRYAMASFISFLTSSFETFKMLEASLPD
jgi:hypothetical protein